jgi:hypothetical protein
VAPSQGCEVLQVDLILALTRNVTGIKLNAFFAPITEEGAQQAAPRQQGFLWQRADGFGHVLRRWIIRCAPRAAARAAPHAAVQRRVRVR